MLTQTQKKQLDILFQKAFINIYPTCDFCGAKSEVAHHVFKRRHLNTRWHLLSSLALCHTCHNHHSPDLEERSKRVYIKKHSTTIYEAMKELSLSIARNIDFIEVKKSLSPYQKKGY